MTPVRRRIIFGEPYRSSTQYELSFEVAGSTYTNPVLSKHYTVQFQNPRNVGDFWITRRVHDHFCIADDEAFQVLLRAATTADDETTTTRFEEYARTHESARHHEPRPGV